jgi:outer membrane protein assembly factor BamD
MRKIFFLIPLIFLACSHKPSKDNLTALKWHKKISKDIKMSNIDKADDDFLCLEAEHPSSPYIKTDLLILAFVHAENEEYEVAKFYLNEYEKRFASTDEIPWIEYKKIYFDFIKYTNAYTNQKAILDLIDECKEYLQNYQTSPFKYEVSTILIKAKLTKKYLDDRIYRLYKKLGKNKAAEKFKTDIPKNSEAPKIPFYKKIFYW